MVVGCHATFDVQGFNLGGGRWLTDLRQIHASFMSPSVLFLVSLAAQKRRFS